MLHGGPGRGAQLLPDDGQPRPATAGRSSTTTSSAAGAAPTCPDADPSFWTVELFVDELRALVDALGIADRFHLLGQSWGGMLGPEFVLADPHGVQSLTICDSPASMPLWLEAANDAAQPAARSRCRRR